MAGAGYPVSLRQLQYAVAVADTRSFRRAAEECHVSQPSLSAQIAQLEAGLGVRLFERDRRRVVATDAGQEILERARRLLVDAGDLVEAARRRSDPLTGTVRIGVIPTVAPYLVPDAAKSLRASFPKLTVAWLEDKTATLAAALGAGTLDAAILALPVPLAGGDVEHEEIADDEFLLATAPGHPLGVDTTPAKAEELRGARILLLDDGHCLRQQALAVCSMVNAQEVGFRATSLPTLVQMVAGGAGVTLLPRLAIPLESSRAELCVREFEPLAPRRTLVLAWRRRTFLSDALRRIAVAIRGAYPRDVTQNVAAGRRPTPPGKRSAQRGERRSAKR
jgi:LysR family transcriptional regulator, hydrogen peroxide-inducible genes activator